MLFVSAAFATLRERFEIATADKSASGNISAPAIRGSFASSRRKESTVIRRYVTVWRTLDTSWSADVSLWPEGSSVFMNARSSGAALRRTWMVGKCHIRDSNTATWLRSSAPDSGGGRRRVRPCGSTRTTAAKMTWTCARLFRFSGISSTSPFLRASQNPATGQSKHCGERGVHRVAPSSIMA